MMTPFNTLTKRENEVAELLLEGKSNKQIAFALGISESTVEFHLRNIYRKLDVVSRGEAMLTLGKSTGLFAGKPRDSLGSVCKLKLCHSEQSKECHFQGVFGQNLRFFVASLLRMTCKRDFAYTP